MIAINNMTYPDSVILNFAIAVKHAQLLVKNKKNPGIKTTVTVEPLTEEILRQKYTNLRVDDYNKNGIVDTWEADSNNDGYPDILYADDDEDGLIEYKQIDSNNNKSYDMWVFDKDLDGRPDQKFIDRDDIPNQKLTSEEWLAKWDAIAVDIDQDGTWDKVQDIPKS